MQEETAEIKGVLAVIIEKLRAESARHSYITNYLVAASAALGSSSSLLACQPLPIHYLVIYSYALELNRVAHASREPGLMDRLTLGVRAFDTSGPYSRESCDSSFGS